MVFGYRASGSSLVQGLERADSRCADYCPHSGGSDFHAIIQQCYYRNKFTCTINGLNLYSHVNE